MAAARRGRQAAVTPGPVRAPAAWKRIVLRPDALVISRGGFRRDGGSVRLSPLWTRIELADRPAGRLRVRLRDGLACGEIGSLLGEAERRSPPRRLAAALHQCRSK